jgi:hypothetical protein
MKAMESNNIAAVGKNLRPCIKRKVNGELHVGANDSTNSQAPGAELVWMPLFQGGVPLDELLCSMTLQQPSNLLVRIIPDQVTEQTSIRRYP